MRVIVHGGMQKAGSSAVQAYLAARRPELLAAGIDYPDFGHRGHWAVSAVFSGNPHTYHLTGKRHHGGEVADTMASVRAELTRRISAPDGTSDTLLLSHEDLSVALTAQRFAAFVAEAGRGAVPVRLVAYARDPVSLFPSATQQALKTRRDSPVPPSAWASRHSQRVTKLKRALGDDVTLKLFAPPGVEGWDVIEDFRGLCGDLLGRTLPPRGEMPDVNSSLSAEACAILYLARSTPRGRSLRSMPRLCRAFAAQVPGTRLRVPPEWARDIAAHNAVAWNEAVGLLDVPAEQKEAARLEERPTGRAYTDADLDAWLLGGLDRDWCAQLATFARTVDLKDNAGVRIARWIEREVIAPAG